MAKKKIILELKNISKKYNDDIVFEKVNLKIKEGDIISIVGKSGCGKSTLLKCIDGLEVINSGEILVDNQSIGNISRSELSKKIGFVFQDYNLFEHLNVLDNLIIGLNKIKKEPFEKCKERAFKILQRIDLAEKWDKYPEELSGGQKQRIAIARTILMNPKVILLDEPTSALDKEMKQEVFNLINEMVKENMTIIIVSHEEEFVKKISTKIYELKKNKLVEYKNL